MWFNLLPERTDELALAGATIRAHQLELEFPYRKDEDCWDGDNLTVTLSPEGGGFQGAVDDNALLLPRAGVEQVVDRFRSTLSAALEDSGRRLSELLVGEPH